jgi:hypothetical protein
MFIGSTQGTQASPGSGMVSSTDLVLIACRPCDHDKERRTVNRLLGSPCWAKFGFRAIESLGVLRASEKLAQQKSLFQRRNTHFANKV